MKIIKYLLDKLKNFNNSIMDNAFSYLASWRILLVLASFCSFFFLVCVRLFDVMILGPRKDYKNNIVTYDQTVPRANILDRNGNVLATHLITASAYVNTNDIIDLKESAQKLQTVLNEYTLEELEQKLSSGKSFIWLARHLTPKKQNAIQSLGVPGVYLKKDYKRVYPYGILASHIIGFCDIDGNGIAGVENSFNSYLWQSNDPLQLSIDINIQHIVTNILSDAVKEFKAIGGNAIIMHVKTGEIIAMESLPNLDPNHPNKYKEECFFNRNTLGTNEPGSVLKILNIAIALESGMVNQNSIFDATEPVKIGRFIVTDFRGQNRPLTLREAFLYSSNIAAVKILQKFGGANVQKKYFEDFGLFDPQPIELSEVGRPIYAKRWTEATAMSSSYGYGIAISPLKLISVINGIINNGTLIEPTIKYKNQISQRKIISKETSKTVRYFMRDVVVNGTAKKSNVSGYGIFGKTGTAYKNKNGGYSNQANRARITTFIGGFPFKDPQYIVLLMLDDPKPTENTFGFATAGWNVAPYAGKIIERIAPLLGIKMHDDKNDIDQKNTEPIEKKVSYNVEPTRKNIKKTILYDNMDSLLSKNYFN